MHIHTNVRQAFSFGPVTVQLWVPDLDQIRDRYNTEQQTAPFPYWAKLWPSAIALCRFITDHPALMAQKTVLELAAGLGLPGIVASHYASQVTVSDYIPDAVDTMSASVDLNERTNIICRQFDWYDLPPDLSADVLLLSDINYEPDAFETLRKVLLLFLERGSTIILATPQRLMARPFIETLLPFCVQQEEIAVSVQEEQVFISVLVLGFGYAQPPAFDQR